MKEKCPLCTDSADFFYKDTQTYYQCKTCDGIFVKKEELKDASSEKERYELHSDDPSDIGYRRFVSPITSSILDEFNAEDKGLDFGSGRSCIVSSILKEENYNIVDYDPFFHVYPEFLEEKYDYISSCEVIEHFYNPYKEFKLLRSMLSQNSKMYIMTQPYTENIDFGSWYYKNDVTHVFFYTQRTFEWIKKEFNFTSVNVGKRLIVFAVV